MQTKWKEVILALRHVPDLILQVSEIPRTETWKIVELAVLIAEIII